MTILQADILAQSRSIRKKLGLWRVIAVLAIAFALLTIMTLSAKKLGAPSASSPHIAKIKIEGVIFDDEKLLKTLEQIDKSQAKAVIFEINSPGGTTAGAEQIYKSMRKIAQTRPTVAVVKTLAASGGYIAAIGADKIYALETSLVGSIGVIVQFPNVAGLLNTLGVKMEEIKTSPLKAAPNGFEPTSDQARQAMQDLVNDSYDWFKNLVSTRRNLTNDELLKISDGRVFTGRQSVSLKLIDELGSEQDAVSWLKKDKNINENLKVKEWSSKGKYGIFSKMVDEPSEAVLNIFGINSKQIIAPKGLVSIWQPS